MSVRSALRSTRLAARARLVRLNWLARTGAHQDFTPFVDPAGEEWRDALARVSSGKRVMMATNTGGHFALTAIDRMLAVALTLRGAAVRTMLCDSALPACQMTEYSLTPSLTALGRDGPDPLLCGYCTGPAAKHIGALALPVDRLSAYLTDADRVEARDLAQAVNSAAGIAGLAWRSMPVGEHALAGALRFYARGDLESEPEGLPILRAYTEAAALTGAAFLRAIEIHQPEALVAHHGLYVPQGLAMAAARARGVRAVTWNPAYRRHCFIFSHEDTYHHTLMNEPVEIWRDGAFSPAARERIVSYLESRRRGDADWIRYHQPPAGQPDDLARLGFHPGKPLIAAFTNVFWDAQLHYPANAFANQRAWLLETIAVFASRPDLQLGIRVHPAEISGSPPARQRAEDEIRKAFPELPGNVVLIGPENPFSSYVLAERADAALIYGTKMGVELSAIGIPVIVAGEAWVRGKGFTIDVRTVEEYRAHLARLPLRARLSEAERTLALRYAHHFFFGRMLEIPFVAEVPGARRFTITARNLSPFRLGATPGLDTICAGILDGRAFVQEPSLLSS